MSTPEQEPAPTFDPEQLKSFSDELLVEALLDDARFATTKLESPERDGVEQRLMDMCWVFTEEEQEAHDEWSDRVDTVLGELSSAIVGFSTGEILDPEEGTQELARRNAGHALGLIERHKRELEEGLRTGRDGDIPHWPQGATAYHLREICDHQAETGINLEGGYVREIALKALPHPGYRGITLLRNAQTGDQASYQLGIEALQKGIAKNNLGHDHAQIGAELVTELLRQAPQEQRLILRNLGIDLLARMRGWMGIPGIPSYTYSYVFAAAGLAITLRDSETQ